ncbi:MAG: 50S ribosomal protein L6 [Rhodospirillales bacterium]|nr:50S ribosomal protein L6 [Rhodospirillales bacterium]
MSRIGKHPVTVPSGVTVSLANDRVTAKGRHGELSATLMDEVVVTHEGDEIVVRPRDDSSRARAMWGTARTVVYNLVTGVDAGFTRKLEIAGVGYRAQVQGRDLVLQLGYSHEVRHPIPDGITVECPDPTHITIQGADKQLVGQMAAEVRAYRRAEPYKGKGIKYDNEIIRRKEGKKK